MRLFFYGVFLFCLLFPCTTSLSAEETPPGSFTWEEDMTPEERAEFDKDFAAPDPVPIPTSETGTIVWDDEEPSGGDELAPPHTDPSPKPVRDPRIEEGEVRILKLASEISDLIQEGKRIRKQMDGCDGEERKRLDRERDELYKKVEALQHQREEIARQVEAVRKEAERNRTMEPDAQALTATQQAFIKGIHADGLGLILADVEAKGNMPRLMTELVELLFMHNHPLMSQETADRELIFENGQQHERQVNRRVDDTSFKESLLYILRDHIQPDSPQQKRMIEAFDSEPNAWTRMRITRAIRKTGGEQAREFCSRLCRTEPRSLAGQEAARGVER